MAQFQLYNYQFGQIKRDAENDLFPEITGASPADESFPKRQDILNEIFIKDYNHLEKITFTNFSSTKEYTHKHLIPPTDGIIVLRIANKKNRKFTNENFDKETKVDYPNCIVIIDNRPGIQRIAIEIRKSVFQNNVVLSKILQNTLNNVLKRFSLYLDLMHLQDSKDFWTLIDDKIAYPKGFYKIRFNLPYLNLERLQKKMDALTKRMRGSYDAKMSLEMTAQQGGQLNFSQNDPTQCAQINYMMEDQGGNSIELIPNDNKKKRINVGKTSMKCVVINEPVFVVLAEDAAGNSLFESSALDNIKQKMKEGID